MGGLENMDIESIDIERLRSDLEDYFGTAIAYNPFGVADVISVDMASDAKLISIALENGFNLDDYEIDRSRN
jgi:hypothetical protein